MNHILRIATATANPYCLALRQPWCSADSEIITQRYGWIINITTTNGYIGIGDCAPLPAAGTETHHMANTALTALLPTLINQSIESSLNFLHTDKYHTIPSTRFGIETALLQILAQSNGLSLSHWFSSTAATSIPVNAAIGTIDSNLTTRIKYAIDAGYTVLKIKLGIQSWSQELEYLQTVATELPPEIKLRVDANQAWNIQQATSMLKQLINLPIEAVEEPLSNPNYKSLAKLQAEVPFALALDESMPKMLKHFFSTQHQSPTRRWIIKPAVIGGLTTAFNLARTAEQHGVEWVITSTLESGVGVLAAAAIAAALNPTLAQGLATSTWFTHDLIPTPVIKNGVLILNTCNYLPHPLAPSP